MPALLVVGLMETDMKKVTYNKHGNFWGIALVILSALPFTANLFPVFAEQEFISPCVDQCVMTYVENSDNNVASGSAVAGQSPEVTLSVEPNDVEGYVRYVFGKNILI